MLTSTGYRLVGGWGKSFKKLNTKWIRMSSIKGTLEKTLSWSTHIVYDICTSPQSVAQPTKFHIAQNASTSPMFSTKLMITVYKTLWSLLNIRCDQEKDVPLHNSTTMKVNMQICRQKYATRIITSTVRPIDVNTGTCDAQPLWRFRHKPSSFKNRSYKLSWESTADANNYVLEVLHRVNWFNGVTTDGSTTGAQQKITVQ
uniref:Uncharacterized protein n=1 Tax=Rhipicephalus zambeziensis TaxID=60191 RepID=A0A224Y6K8_9ACAR